MVKETKFYDVLGVRAYRSIPYHPSSRPLTAYQVAPTATDAELKKAYKTGALKFHPGMSRAALMMRDSGH